MGVYFAVLSFHMYSIRYTYDLVWLHESGCRVDVEMLNITEAHYIVVRNDGRQKG